MIMNLLAAALGAAVASYFGALFGVRKFRGERGFERRLHWYEGCYRDLVTLIKNTNRLQAILSHEPDLEFGEEDRKFWEQMYNTFLDRMYEAAFLC